MRRKGGKKRALLLVTFGPTTDQARRALDGFAAQVAQIYPDVPLTWAYTSRLARRKSAAGGGAVIDAPEVALARLMDGGRTHVAVQALQLIPGIEHTALRHNLLAFERMSPGLAKVALGAPLIDSAADLEALASALPQIVPQERRPDEAVVLVGHGTGHFANCAYAALMFFLQRHDPHLFVGALNHGPDMALIKSLLTERAIKRVWLMPLLTIVGNHTLRDMAGDDADSWKTGLNQAGFFCETVIKGLLEYEILAALWLDHLRAAVTALG